MVYQFGPFLRLYVLMGQVLLINLWRICFFYGIILIQETYIMSNNLSFNLDKVFKHNIKYKARKTAVQWENLLPSPSPNKVYPKITQKRININLKEKSPLWHSECVLK